MIINILLTIDILLIISVVYILYKIKKPKHINDVIIDKPHELINKDIINSMNNVELINFIKERFNFPDYCKMCNNFNHIDSNEDICRFKGMYDTKCKEGFEKWLNDHNNLEGDMNADIN